MNHQQSQYPHQKGHRDEQWNFAPISYINPSFPLYLTKTSNSIIARRTLDGFQISNIIIRNMQNVIAIDWDSKTGKYLTINFDDGTFRIYDIFQDGKLITLVRPQRNLLDIHRKTKVDNAIWDRLIILNSIQELEFNHDITKLMPTLIKFVKDSTNIYIVPYSHNEKQNIWREFQPVSSYKPISTNMDAIDMTTNQEVEKSMRYLDLHIIHVIDPDCFTIAINGTYQINLVRKTINTTNRNKIVRILKSTVHGVYHCFHENGSIRSLYFSHFTSSTLHVELLEIFMEINEMIKYFQYHLDLINKHLLKTFTDFLYPTIFEEKQNGGGNSMLQQLKLSLLSGEMSEELIEWLTLSIGEKNLKKWKRLSEELYSKSIQIFSLALIPACELTLLLSQKCLAILNAIEIEKKARIRAKSKLSTNSTHTNIELNSRQDKILTEFSPSFLELIEILQKFGSRCLQNLRKISYIEKQSSLFLKWLQEMIFHALDEDHVPKLDTYSNPIICLDLSNFLNKLIVLSTDKNKEDREEDQNPLVNDDDENELFCSMEETTTMLQRINYLSRSIDEKGIQPTLQQCLYLGPNIQFITEREFDPSKEITVKDVVKVLNGSILLYLLQVKSLDSRDLFYVGTINVVDLKPICHPKLIQFPLTSNEIINITDVQLLTDIKLVSTNSNNNDDDSMIDEIGPFFNLFIMFDTVSSMNNREVNSKIWYRIRKSNEHYGVVSTELIPDLSNVFAN
ncbi:anaphase promoting complex subunit 4 NDAI_0J01270 [Naumovozyma dairenensis CBS 421]|uniref:Anaphase-promoting complex subunit 4 n=1 Tax=Naumovozyma dairenensis (strain ATCC 10597 / BCRC 20456 / CBS 421 / NBRC 0211 / NRRL Y-12639) TaxID=1071378 RepID=G0WGU1_NAUDC|nr:hypothetical protein NDAI_0J01270 [Naumovozyma dairenensis CBS 421]CCD27019.1 hypothetical protein NDAI_0J01270 [Naumovozyma dairenensis CBS 421]